MVAHQTYSLTLPRLWFAVAYLDAEIRISFDAASSQVTITSCAADSVPDKTISELTGMQCATKWEGKFEY